ncbi:unnamed protein product [Urochloa humidicola]
MSAAEALGLPPGVRFDPTGEELVEFFLLPRALGRAPAVPGVILEADAAAAASPAASHPWKLLTRHRRTDDDGAYWFEGISTSDDGGGARQTRSCGRRWTWVGQKRCPDEALTLPGGDRISWGKYSLNLQEGRGKRGGSTGWVLHEYTATSPPEGPPLPVKLCHIAFTGHGQKRQRVPDDYDDDGGEVEGQEHKRAAASSSSSSVVTTAAPMDQEQRLLSCGASSDGNFGGSDPGFSQESPVLNNPWYPDAESSKKQPFALDQELAQNQESLSFSYQSQEPFVSYGASSAGEFWGSNAGFSQESSVLDSSQQQPHALDQQFDRNQALSSNQSQEQLVGSSIGDYCALLQAPGFGSSQEAPAGHFLTYDQQLQLELAQLLAEIGSPPAGAQAAHHEEHIKTPAMAGVVPLPTDQESCTTEQPDGDIGDFFAGWGDLNTFCDTTGVQSDDEAAGSPERLPAEVVEVQPVSGAKRKLNFDLDRHFSDQQA